MASSPKQPSASMQQQAFTPPPPQVNLTTTGYGNMGYRLPKDPMSMGTPETGQGLAPPSWMQGAFAAPWWGKQAPNVGQAMLQQQRPDEDAPDEDPKKDPTSLSQDDIMAMIKAEQERLRAQMEQERSQAIRGAGYAQDRDWMLGVGGPMGVDPYGNGNSQWSPQSLLAEDQQWLNNRQG